MGYSGDRRRKDGVDGVSYMTDRRAFLKTAAWSVPVIAAAVAVPLAAASILPTRDRLVFNTAGSWDENPNGERARIGVVVAAMDTTGPDAVGLVTLSITIEHEGGSETKTHVGNIVRGWGATKDWTEHFDIVGRAYKITVTASAEGCTTITKGWTK